MSSNVATYPLKAVRGLALHSQGLADGRPATEDATRDTIYSTIQKVGWVQIDTLQVVHRSQNLVLWSRLGCYDTADLGLLLSSPDERRIFEYWLHAACLIPLGDYRYSLPFMREYRDRRRNGQWLRRAGNARLLSDVLARVRQDGALRGGDFEYTGPARGSWWDWKPAKRALEVLYDQGELMIADRVNFQRLYDLKERVLPSWVDTTEPSREEAVRHLLTRSMRALGVCRLGQVADYANVKRGEARPILEDLVADGTFRQVSARLADGSTAELVAHREGVPLLDRAADGGMAPGRTTFLSPFDSLFWARGRDRDFWSFRNVLEAYKPEPSRIWGYFCLPILFRDRIVGRFDPKLDRRAGVLRLKALLLEPGVDPDEELVAAVGGAMRDFMAFHGAGELVVERSEPAGLARRLVDSL